MDVISKNNLIHLRNAEFTIFNNIIICNHLYKITKQIYLESSSLNIFGGKICNNKCINNSEIYSNESSTNGDYT